MNRLIGAMAFIMGGIFLLGQVKVFNTGPLTTEEITQKQRQLFDQLDSLEGNAERDSFSRTIMKEIRKLDEQKALLTKHKD